MPFLRPATIAAAAALLCAVALAQTAGGRISGRVTDPADLVVPGAAVTARQLETGLERATRTNAAGEFTFPLLPVGRYRISAAYGGFQTAERDVRLEVGRQIEIRLALDVSTKTVLITEPVLLVDPD